MGTWYRAWRRRQGGRISTANRGIGAVAPTGGVCVTPLIHQRGAAPVGPRRRLGSMMACSRSYPAASTVNRTGRSAGRRSVAAPSFVVITREGG